MFTSSMGGMGGMSQIDSMIYRILEAEQEPLFNMHDQTVELDNQIKAYQDINTKLDTFKKEAAKIDAATFGSVAESSNDKLVTAEVDSDISSISYEVEVEQLAQSQRLVSTADNRVDGWEDSSGKFHLRTENNIGFEVVIDNDEDEELELTDIAAAINRAEGNDDLVQAVVIEDNLMLEVGESNTDLVVEDGDGILESLGILEDEDTKFEINTSTIQFNDPEDLGDGTLTVTIDGEDHEIDLGDLADIDELRTELESKVVDEDTMVELTDDNQIVINSHEEIDVTGSGDFTVESDTRENHLLDLTDETDDRLLRKAQGSIAKINGLTVEADSNQLDEAVEGVTFHLHQETPEDEGPTTIDVEIDKEGIKEAIEDFVEGYNELVDLMDLYSNPRRTSDTKELDDEDEGAEEVIEGGILQGESQLRNLQSRLYNSVIMPVDDVGVDGQTRSLSQFGIQLQDDGRLEIEDSRSWGQTLDDAIENNLDELRELFTRESVDYIGQEDLEDVLGQNTFTLEVDGEEQTVEADGGSFGDLESLIAAINDNEDGISRVIAREGDNGRLNFISYRNLSDPDGFVQQESPGIIERIENNIEAATDRFSGYIGEEGGRTGRIPTLENEIDRINDNIERGLERLEAREDSLRQQFMRMEQITAEMQSQMQRIGAFGLF
ncbi:flagellar filament capping protein FliD [Natroniella acetigena]|uniref:flagellar filament capping protein FliD n=1 Tax=Natroniella acetigena TaxID=52004 RepID=UPI00200A5198|nr:flagellar filament capping protein FliD [Natroniella acetigena]